MKIRVENIDLPDPQHAFLSANVIFEEITENPCSYLGSEVKVLVCFPVAGDPTLSAVKASAIAQAKQLLSLALQEAERA